MDNDEPLREIGKAVARAREARGLPWHVLAGFAGVAAGTVKRIERGEGVTSTKLQKVLDALDMDLTATRRLA